MWNNKFTTIGRYHIHKVNSIKWKTIFFKKLLFDILSLFQRFLKSYHMLIYICIFIIYIYHLPNTYEHVGNIRIWKWRMLSEVSFDFIYTCMFRIYIKTIKISTWVERRLVRNRSRENTTSNDLITAGPLTQ